MICYSAKTRKQDRPEVAHSVKTRKRVRAEMNSRRRFLAPELGFEQRWPHRNTCATQHCKPNTNQSMPALIRFEGISGSTGLYCTPLRALLGSTDPAASSTWLYCTPLRAVPRCKLYWALLHPAASSTELYRSLLRALPGSTAPRCKLLLGSTAPRCELYLALLHAAASSSIAPRCEL